MKGSTCDLVETRIVFSLVPGELNQPNRSASMRLIRALPNAEDALVLVRQGDEPPK
jgi:hypothetical protein